MAMERSTEPDAFTRFERAGWDAAIGGYERTLGRLTANSVGAMLDAARVGPRHRVLDVCTGHGILVAAALARGAAAQGLDFAPEVLAAARRNVPGARFEQGDAQLLPHPDASFDRVLCGYGIVHLPDPERALREMRRVLRPGGRMAVSVWGRAEPSNGLGLIYSAVRTHGRLDVPLPQGPDFFQFGDPASLQAALSEIGLVDVEAAIFSQDWRLARRADLLDAILQGTVRAKALLEAQTGESLAAITRAVEDGMARFGREDTGYAVPMPAVIGSGSKG